MCEYKMPLVCQVVVTSVPPPYSLFMSMGCLYCRTFTRVENEDSSIVRTIERYRYERVHDINVMTHLAAENVLSLLIGQKISTGASYWSVSEGNINILLTVDDVF